ncbi:uncharacterized protein LOC142634909 [Castanea sativa]|uniref:uncharacterized protein LOC142634909 n=1 Tax=Castanea sativa TaxID=21020 RepID=UPI003F64B735
MGEQPFEKKLRYTQQPIAFNDDDMEGTIQTHDDALVVTACINGFIVKRVMIDQGSGANVMYPDLYRGLGLKKEDLSKYDTPLMEFDSHMVIPEGQISLPVSMEDKEVIVTFIVVASFSPYTTNLEKVVDSCHGSRAVHLACEGQVLHREGNSRDKGQSTSSQTILSGHG